MSHGLKNGSDGSNGYVEKLEGQPQGQQFESQPVQRNGVLHKTGRHFKKWWWLHLIVFCVVFLLIALLLVYVGMPRIAQNGVNDSSLSFFSLQFLQPSTKTISLTQEAQLHSPSIFTPTLDPFVAGLWLVTNGTFGPRPFVNIQFPTVHALHPNSNVSFANQVLEILDEDQLTQYAIQVLSQKNVSTALTGRTNLHIGKLPTVGINYNSTTTYDSLNGLQGFNTTDLRILLTAKAGQPNLVGNAFVPNPSVMTIEMGKVTLSLATSKGVVGNATIDNMTIRPGDNNFQMNAIVDQLAIASAAVGGKVNVTITGTSAVYNGQHLPYYEKALASNVLHLEMNLAQILADSAAAAKTN